MTKYWRFLPIIILFALAILFLPSQIKEKPVTKLKVKVSDQAKPAILTLMQKYPDYSTKIELDETNPQVLIDIQKPTSSQNLIEVGQIDNQIEFFGAGFDRKIGSQTTYYLADIEPAQKIIDRLKDSYQQTEKQIIYHKLANYLKQELKTEKKPEVSLNLVGDIIPSRTVYLKMTQKGFNYPFINAAEETSAADLTFGNLESPISDLVKPPTEGMSFATPTKVLPGLQSLGLDLVTLANNHSTNYGGEVFADTLKNLETAGIKYVGGGTNEAAAHELKIIEAKGLKIGILNYNSIIGGLAAEANSPGIAWIHMPPWSEQINQDELIRIKSEITSARPEVDFLVVAVHWGVEYQLEPIPAQVQVAHEAIDAGADLIWGSHPHVPSTFESYKNKFVIYNLGNFIFDQMWSEETREGVIAKLHIQGAEIKKVELIPYKIADFAQPQILPGDSGRYIIERMMSKSRLE